MRRYWVIIPGLLVAGLILAMTAFDAPQANADNGPHQQGWGVTPDGCAACHRVHRGENEYLLLGEVETLCESCHGSGALGSTLNVVEGTDDNDGGALRAGGFEFARIDTTDPTLPISVNPSGLSGSAANAARDVPGSLCWQNGIDDDADTVVDDGCRPHINALAAPGETTQSSHSVDDSAQLLWGNGAISGVANPGLAGYQLDCGKCHDPHGNGNYRILRSVPSGSGGAGYTIPDTYPKDEDAGDYTTSNYFDMTFTGNEATDNILKDTSAWCAQCHTRYLAARRAALPADASRVDSGDAIFKFRHTSAGIGYSATPPAGVPTPNNRACITCHAVHGSNSTAGEFSGAVPNPDGYVPVPTVQPANNKLLKMDNRGMCQKCHNQ